MIKFTGRKMVIFFKGIYTYLIGSGSGPKRCGFANSNSSVINNLQHIISLIEKTKSSIKLLILTELATGKQQNSVSSSKNICGQMMPQSLTRKFSTSSFSWGTPCESQAVTTFQEGSTKVKDQFKLHLYERNVQVSDNHYLTAL